MYIYYMASSASRQDEPNPALWLATRAGKMERYCPLGIARFVPAITFRRSPRGCTKVFFRKIFSVTVIKKDFLGFLCRDGTKKGENLNALSLLHITGFLFSARKWSWLKLYTSNIRVTYEYIRVHTSNIRVTYEYTRLNMVICRLYTNTLVTYECIGAINMKCTIFLVTFHFYMWAGPALHTHANASKGHTRAYHTHAPHLLNTRKDWVQSKVQFRGETASLHEDVKPISIGEYIDLQIILKWALRHKASHIDFE